MKLNFQYCVDYEVIENAFIKGNWNGNFEREVSFDLSELSEQARKNLATLSFSGEFVEGEGPMSEILLEYDEDDPEAPADVSLGLFYVQAEKSSPPVMVFKPYDFSKAELTLADVENWLEEMVQSEHQSSELLEQAQEEYRIAKREQEKAKKIEEARIEKARNRERSKMLRWAKAYGSERLRLGLKLGYDCDRLYVTERANVEYPGFIVDYVGEAESYYQINPGLDALKLAKALRGKGKKAHVVFLLTDPQGDEGNDFEPCEAVVIEGFLGEYNLYKLME